VEAPLAVSIAEFPAQIKETEAPMLTVGIALTVIVLEATEEQPAELVPVTE